MPFDCSSSCSLLFYYFHKDLLDCKEPTATVVRFHCELAPGQLLLYGAIIKAANVTKEDQGSLMDDSFDGNCATENVACRICDSRWKRQHMFNEVLVCSFELHH